MIFTRKGVNLPCSALCKAVDQYIAMYALLSMLVKWQCGKMPSAKEGD
jgi:hypothetical protein